jgi:multiple sugar transport system ATP-binding protein
VAGIALKKIRKSYGALQVIHDINIEIRSGEFLVLVGPSGCGKSTLLRMIAGLEEISGGELDIEGRTVNLLPPAERNIAMVFQDYALYPHMSVRENMSFGLKMRGGDDREIESRVGQAADVLKIRDYLDRRPAQLSGGQRQRVAMGRAIVREPAAFLFDEPLSNLDAALRVEMRLEIAKLHNRMKATTVYVTHDQVEAMTLADRIVVMNGGVVEQIGKPLDLYHNPSSLFVARFIGSPTMNTLPAEIASDGESLKLLGKTAAGSIPGAGTLAGRGRHARNSARRADPLLPRTGLVQRRTDGGRTARQPDLRLCRSGPFENADRRVPPRPRHRGRRNDPCEGQSREGAPVRRRDRQKAELKPGAVGASCGDAIEDDHRRGTGRED